MPQLPTSDIYNANRSGGTGNPYSSQIADQYNQQISNLQQENANLKTSVNGYDNLQYQTNLNNIQLYQEASNNVNALADEYKRQLQSQSLGMQNAQKYLGNQLQAQGMGQVGASESSINGVRSMYQNNIASLGNSFNSGLTSISNNLQSNKNANEMQHASDVSTLNSENRNNFVNAINNTNSLEDLEKVQELYKDFASNESTLAYSNRKSYIAYNDALDSLEQSISNGKDSVTDLTAIADKYKAYLNNNDLANLQSAVAELNTRSKITAVGGNGDINADGNIILSSYDTGASISKDLGVAKGTEQTNYAQAVLDNLSEANGKYVVLNYGSHTGNVAYYVDGNRLYKVDVTSNNKSVVFKNLYIPKGYVNNSTSFARIVKETE